MARRPRKIKQINKVKNAYYLHKQRFNCNKVLMSFFGIPKILFVNAPMKPQISKFIPRHKRRYENKLIRYKCTRISFRVKCKLSGYKYNKPITPLIWLTTRGDT